MSDLRFNVAQLLREYVGAKRRHEFDEPHLELAEGLQMKPLVGQAKFTRTKSGVLATVEARGQVSQECGRCLVEYQQPVEVHFDEEFFNMVHVTLGTPMPKPDQDDVFMIDENHLLDLGEAIREYALLALPIAPLCREDCQGLCPQCGTNRNETPCDCVEDVVDERMAALKRLLNQD